LKALLDKLGIEKIHIISTSYGGVVGLHFTLTYPGYVQSLMLIDGLAETDGNFRWTIANWQELLQEGDMVSLFRAIVPAIYSNFYLENNEKALREREQLLKNSPRDFMEAFSRLLTNALQNSNYPHELHKIKCPVFLACGDHDHLTPIRLSRIIKEQIPQAEFVVIPQCGHTTIYEKPDLVNTLALGFIIKNI
jgi:3-oxoadipate enol-lactonase